MPGALACCPSLASCFLFAWQMIASQVQTRFKCLPGLVATAKQFGVLYQEYRGEQQNKAEFYARQEARNAQKLKANPAAEVKIRPYTGRATFLEQVLTSLLTVAAGFWWWRPSSPFRWASCWG